MFITMFVGRRVRNVLGVVFLLLTMVAGSSVPALAEADHEGAVVVLTNAAAGNAVAMFARGDHGALTEVGAFPTGGAGTDAGLGSQGALALSKNGRLLFAVNAGSNDVSVFAVRRGGLTLVDRIASGGETPISLTSHGDLLYVLNAGGSGNISGFRVGRDGKLAALDGSTQPLSNSGAGAAPGPAEIQFNLKGNFLAVTEKGSNMIDIYGVDKDGRAGAPQSFPAAGQTPFGFDFDKHGNLLTTEAFGAAAGQGAVSSYALSKTGALQVISPSVGNTQTAACWLVVSPNGRFAYTTNTPAGTISTYGLSPDGSIRLLAPLAADPGPASKPIDAAFDKDGEYLYVLTGGLQTVQAYRVKDDGALVAAGSAGNLPASAAGVAAW